MSTVRIAPTSEETAESDWWQPDGETYMQATGPGHVIVIVETRIDNATVPALVERTSIKANPMLRLAQMPWLRVRTAGNATGELVAVKSEEP